MLDIFIPDNWSKPILAIPSSIWENLGVGFGFLTPTPIAISTDIVRVFGGVRDREGRSTINWIDLDSKTAEILDYSRSPCLDTRDSGEFDSDGAILGDVFWYASQLCMFYIGFEKSENVKFKAYTGFATSNNLGLSWQKKFSPALENLKSQMSSEIFAVHSVKLSENYAELFIAIGDGWQKINGESFPRYKTYKAEGKNFESLKLDTDILLPQSDEIYRLGRPRLFQEPNGNTKYILATGGKLNGDYRPYIYKETFGKWHLTNEQFPVRPSSHLDFSKQVSYPTHIISNNSLWFFFNGDNMGSLGGYLIKNVNYYESSIS